MHKIVVRSLTDVEDAANYLLSAFLDKTLEKREVSITIFTGGSTFQQLARAKEEQCRSEAG